MDINVLKTFVAVCEHSGFTAAGEKLGYTQSTVSSQIRQLEKELGVTLFDRFYHRIAMTDAGRCVLASAREMLDAQERMDQQLHHAGEVRGNLCLAMSSSACTRYFGADYLDFRKKYPGVRLKLVEADTEQMFSMLQKNEADLVFTLDTHVYVPEFEICAEREEHVHFVASPGHPLAGRGSLGLRDILSCDIIFTERGMSYRRMLEEALAAQNMAVTPALELGNTNQICLIAEKSEMVGFLPDFTTQSFVDEGRLVRLPVEDLDVSVWTQLLIHKNKWRSAALTALIDYYAKLIRG